MQSTAVFAVGYFLEVQCGAVCLRMFFGVQCAVFLRLDISGGAMYSRLPSWESSRSSCSALLLAVLIFLRGAALLFVLVCARSVRSSKATSLGRGQARGASWYFALVSSCLGDFGGNYTPLHTRTTAVPLCP